MKALKTAAALILALAINAQAAGFFGGGSGTAVNIISGTTTITGGTNGDFCYDNAGVIDCATYSPTGTGLKVATGTGTYTNGNCVRIDANGNLIDAGAPCGTGAGTVTGSGTANTIPVWSTSSALGDSNLINNAQGVTIGAKSTQQDYTNNGTTGTVTNKPVKNDGSGNVIVTNSATDAIKGICSSGCGIGGTAHVSVSGAGVSCVFAGTATAGHYVTTNTSGQCVDGGAAFPTDGSSVIGTVNTGGVGAGTYTIDLNGMDVASASSGGGGGGAKNPAGSVGDVQFRASGNNFAAEAAFNYTASTNTLVVGTGPTITLIGGTLSSSDAFNIAAGTLPDVNSRIIGAGGTLASGDAVGVSFFPTSAGTAAAQQRGSVFSLLAGYTGSNVLYAATAQNLARSTGTSASVGSTSGITGNVGFGGFATNSGSSGSGNTYAIVGEANKSTGANYGLYGRAVDAIDGTNVAVLGSATGSTEATNMKNIAGWFTLTTTDPAAVADNVSVALVAASDGTADIFRGYNAATKVYSISKDGNEATAGTITSSRTTDLGWSLQSAANQACNTTCTSACVFGFDTAITPTPVACTDATADTCLCAGAS